MTSLGSKNAVIFAGGVFGNMVYIKLLKINKNQLIKRWIDYIGVEKTACLFAFQVLNEKC